MTNDNLRENLRRAASRRGYQLRHNQDGSYSLRRKGAPASRQPMLFHDLEDVRSELRLLNSELPSRAA
jgi:hypothetical protein